jgi:hypothetical protein
VNDLEAAGKLFDVLYLAADRHLAPDFMLRLFRNAISPSLASRFLGRCPLDYFLSLQDLPEIAELIEQGEERRVYDFLRKCVDDRSRRWLRQRTSIAVETLNDVIEHEGTVPIRAAWESVANIPIVVDDSKLGALLLFVQQFIHSDEVPFVVEKWPDVLPSLLSAWGSDFACFRPVFKANFEGIVTGLLNQDLGLARFLLRVFPDDERLTQLTAKKVRSRLDQDGILLTDIFDYFRPPSELLDRIILSDAIEAVEPDDSLVALIERRIPELVETVNPLALAQASATFVRCAKRDPISMAIRH